MFTIYVLFKFKRVHHDVVSLCFLVAFAVDPLYHQTSAQFDEGGAKGLLLNNLGVYAGCSVLFDSLEVPGKDVSFENQNYESATIDLSFARGLLLLNWILLCPSVSIC